MAAAADAVTVLAQLARLGHGAMAVAKEPCTMSIRVQPLGGEFVDMVSCISSAFLYFWSR